jgi:hypothetical protein
MMDTLKKEWHPWRSVIVIIGAVFITAVLAFFFGANAPVSYGSNKNARISGSTQMISAKDLAELYGLRVTLIGVTAGGGLVDLRFKILDAQKAMKLLENHDNMPALIPAGSQVRLGIPGVHGAEYETGKVYYMLYGNANGIVRPGTPVSVAFGNLVLEPITAQ